ncbi:MAG TPA: phosphatase PAP2 family protein [Gemmatimonadales bacterium]|nr:phosphatase PAP2 family protein [Gemmatimonadales bacterium]
MRRSIVALASSAIALRAAVAQAPVPVPSPPPYRVTWWDAATIAGAGTLAAIPVLAGLPHGPPPCAPCDPASLPSIDRAALHTFSGPAGTASTVLLVAVAGFGGVASTEGGGGIWGPRVRGHAVVFANALAWTVATTEWVKVLAHRSRPVLYTAAAPAAASDRDNRRSFPSGHSAAAFSVATAYLVMAQREHLPHRARNAVLLFGGAATVAALRVAAGQHFPSDVVAGAAVGSGIGWLVTHVRAIAR